MAINKKREQRMNTYKDGYQAGWTSYLKSCKAPTGDSFARFIEEAQKLAEKADLALSPQQQKDYWLGHHHGRSAAKTRVIAQQFSHCLNLLDVEC